MPIQAGVAAMADRLSCRASAWTSDPHARPPLVRKTALGSHDTCIQGVIAVWGGFLACLFALTTKECRR